MLSKTLVNVTQLAELVGMNRNMVARRLRETEMDGGNGENLKQYELGKALRVLIMPSVQENGEMSPQDRKAWYQSENERIKFEQSERELIPADEVIREYSVMAKAVVQILETLPDILERDCALTPAAVARVQAVIDDLRDEMARKVSESESEDGWPASQVQE
ncbi:TPA: DUF1441 family protein [Klebsiella pneumoniae]|uniref:DUF1441 family protein n=1 Tax=Klebsiella pneumoniae TaxID=573 RepID=UPI0020CCF7F6|nr:DUF1441 family protein [Klebsiella pneumoniae]MCQ0814094.1 DUF1441 family protein [Klebsiella pneumoniae]HBS2458717.1 DUF1441 family protein [Klebsiella pneumoniae]HBS2469855.1 DUF1441 family protein [Klebsiella pneumoniae]HBS2495730.1 DUF1441 family protein [Klebsiella pneumoniae]HBS2525791.1 DUF1441 family protein [Klebsiella pneumoniae]